jgi:glutathione S-transferase
MPIDYLEVPQARELPGLRLVLTTGVPGPWGEAAKAVFGVKGIAYAPVRQTAMQIDPALLEWTRQTSAPVAMYEDERPRSGWAEILFLAERLNPEPSLVPEDPRERAWMLGLCHEICGENGLGWTRRRQLLSGAPAQEQDSLPWKYGGSDGAPGDAAQARVLDILALLSDQLNSTPGDYLMGAELRAVDLYWACFSNLIQPLTEEQSPMPKFIRGSYGAWDGGCADSLLALRDRVFEQHIGLPQEF